MVSIIYEHLHATNVVVSLWFVLKLQWGFFSFWWRCGLHWRCDGSVYMHLQLCSTRQHFCNTNLFTPPSQHTSIMFHILATMALKCSLKLLMEESIMAIVFQLILLISSFCRFKCYGLVHFCYGQWELVQHPFCHDLLWGSLNDII